METEITDPILSPEQESKEIAIIAKASIANIEANKKAYEALRDEYKGTKAPELTDPEFKATLKKLTQGSGALVKARTAATKLGKQETDKLDKVKVMIKSAVEELIAITADTEKEIKAEKERAEQMVADEKAEKERQAEEAKQARIAKLYELGLTHNGSYYSLGDLSITPVQITQFTEAQFEGFVAQATVEFEAIKLKEEEEKARQEQEQAGLIANQQKLQQENEAKQRELDEAARKQKEQDDLIAELQAKLKAQEPVKQPEETKVVATYHGKPSPLNGSHILEPVADNEYMDEVLAQPNDGLVDDEFPTDDERWAVVTHRYTQSNPFRDVKVGPNIFRVYHEEFLDEVNKSVPADMKVISTGNFGSHELFMVIKPR